MQKLMTCKTITIFIATIIVPIIGMEKSSLTTEIPKFIVTLHLNEASQEDVFHPWCRRFNKTDEHACTVLGIAWEENNNTYFTKEALIKKCGDAKYIKCWKNNYPTGILPLSKIPNMSTPEKDRYLIKFPSSLPASFVEKLEKEKSIILENIQLAEPVKIVIQLGSINKLSEHS